MSGIPRSASAGAIRAWFAHRPKRSTVITAAMSVPLATQRVDRVNEQSGVDVAVARVSIDKDWLGACVDDGVGRGRERHRRDDDHPSGPRSEVQQRQVQRCGARR